MSRLLLVAFAAMVTIGAAFDATVSRDAVGLRTLGQQEAIDAGSPSGEVLTLVDRAREYGGPNERYGGYLALRDHAPGAHLIVEATIPRAELPPILLRAIGGAGSVTAVERRAMSPVEALFDGPDGPPLLPTSRLTAEGRSKSGPWRLWTAEGPVATLVIVQQARTMHYVDARLVPGLDVSDHPSGGGASLDVGSTGSGGDLTRAILGESFVLILLLLAGGLLLPHRILPLSQRLPLALIVGLAMHATLGVLLLPGVVGLIASVGTATLLAVRAALLHGALGWRPTDLRGLIATAVVIVAIVSWARMTGALVVTPDSFTYWAGGAAMADGTLGIADLEVKRGVTQQALHAAGFAVGAEGLQAVGHVLLIAGFGLVLSVVPSLRRVHGRSPAGLVAVILVAALIISPQIVTFAAYLNAHVLVAVLLLALVLLLGPGAEGRGTGGRVIDAQRRRDLLPAVVAVMGALVMSRAEGAALVALALAGTLAAPTVRPVWRTAWTASGVLSLIWAAVLLVGQGPVPSTALIAFTGVLALLTAAVGVALPHRARRTLQIALLAMLWTAALILSRGEDVRFVAVVARNLGEGLGGWGVLAPLLLLAGLAAVLWTSRVDDLTSLATRSLLIGFIPLTMLAKLGDGLDAEESALDVLLAGGGRIGWGDSVNRMWMHAVLLVALLLVRSAVVDRRQPFRAVGLVAAGTWVVSQWAPAYTPSDPVVEEVTVVETIGTAPVGELLDGSEVRQTFLLGPPTVDDARADGVRPRAVCIAVPIVTYARAANGELEFALEGAGLRAVREVPSVGLVDWGTVDLCLDVQEATTPVTSVELLVRATGSGPGAAPSVLTGQGASIGALVTIPGDAGVNASTTSRRVGPLAATVTLVTERPLGRFESLPERVPTAIPWFALLLATASSVVPGVPGRGSRSEPVRRTP